MWLRNVGNTWEDNIQAYFEVTYLKLFQQYTLYNDFKDFL